ncbi:CPBP family intramembrane glutamic endopeptidase [Bacteroides sp. AN502(2024)]|uniref:CPBP family intramembrane glutamic endopeptidase n=1 Tax=Bacteroides sp. AN502(2024) TaxID=3160599 RepID=UPI003518D952
MEADNMGGRKGPSRLPVWACIPLFIVVLSIFIGLYGTLVSGCLSLVLGAEARHSGVVGYIFVEVGMLLAVLTAAVILLRLERRPFSDLGLSLKGHASGVWYGLLMAIFLYLLGFGISVVGGGIEVIGFQFNPLDLWESWVFFLLVALFEEILMRGYILGHLLHTHMNKFLAIFASSALFAFMHIFNPEIAFLPMLNLLLAGMLLGTSYLYTRNLCFPISLHLFWNWIQGPILGYQVSGNNFTTSMLTLRIPEKNILNGGAFGFEGSLICTVLMIVFTILMVWWGEKREAISLAVLRSC